MNLLCLSLFLLICLVPSISCLVCYSCNGQPDCVDPYTKNYQYLLTCSSGYTACQKITYTTSGTSNVIRTCSASCSVGQINYNGLIVNSYCCGNDYCNGADVMSSNKLTVLMMITSGFLLVFKLVK